MTYCSECHCDDPLLHWTPSDSLSLHPRHEELLVKGGLYSDMWMRQQQAQDSDSSSDTETKDRTSEKLQPPSTSSGHHGHWMYLFCFERELSFECAMAGYGERGRCLNQTEEARTILLFIPQGIGCNNYGEGFVCRDRTKRSNHYRIIKTDICTFFSKPIEWKVVHVVPCLHLEDTLRVYTFKFVLRMLFILEVLFLAFKMLSLFLY